MSRLTEARMKISALRGEMEARGLSGALICQQPNFSYLTAGGRGFLGLASTAACAMLLVTRDCVYLLANVIEGPRLMKEEIPEGLCELKTLPWQEDGGLRALAKSLTKGALADDGELSAYFQSARIILCEEERERYRLLGRDSARAMERALKQTQIGDTESAIAGRISAALWGIGAEPISLFVAADDRSKEVRHFVPSLRAAQKKVIASICARRGGLVISATRSVALGSVCPVWEENYEKLMRVESAMFDAIRPGKPLRDCYDAAARAYETEKLPGEYNNHHQGGLTGYLPREIRMDASSSILMAEGMAFAFNPSCAGAKAEDTLLLTDKGPQTLSDSGEWPMTEVCGYLRPRIVSVGKESGV